MNLRSPLGRVRGLGAARTGVHHWWAQRTTAVALVPLMLWLVTNLVCLAGAGYDEVLAWASTPLASTLLIALIISLFYHAQLGLQVVLEDYVHSPWAQVPAQLAVRYACVLLALTGVLSVLEIALGG
jgi:succinate dehydrogenase / fumarate reductase membrane anchor subunit